MGSLSKAAFLLAIGESGAHERRETEALYFKENSYLVCIDRVSRVDVSCERYRDSREQ